MRLFSYRDRPHHLGPYPLERLNRTARPAPAPFDRGHQGPQPDPAGRSFPLSRPLNDYLAQFSQFRDGEIAPGRAPVAPDPAGHARNLKSGCYNLDATMAGVAALADDIWLEGPAGPERLDHQFGLVILIGHPKTPAPGAPGADWMLGSEDQLCDLRATEIAIVMAGYIRRLGFSARAHGAGGAEVDIHGLVVAAGLATGGGGGTRPRNPFLGARYRAAVVTTDWPLEPDQRLAPEGNFGHWWWTRGPGRGLGLGGVRPGWSWLNGAGRAAHLGLYPMEKIRRVPVPTTLITDQVPRVPKRANFFTRALKGDLGPKAARERKRFALKMPYAEAMAPLLRAMVSGQDGQVAAARAPATDDPARNARAIKAASYFLGGDMVGICEARAFAWYSHDDAGDEIEPYHQTAIVILIDQGHETMDGASGDDWISGAQSMRAYMRGGEMAGVLAQHIRSLGYSARSQTNLDSDVLHIPLVLLAGLGELSRIGELVLNPFVGPRFKSVVVTTDMPLAADQPIDFGLQDFCNKCLKCARECPCHAISFGPKVMFNGYEMWKPDAEKCARYRVTNPKGSACGRCMKMCPYNTEGLLGERLFLWAAIHLPFTRKWIAIFDDKVGNGTRNPKKRWWYDLEMIDGVAATPRAGVNERDLNFKGVMRPEDQKIAHYPADVAPPPNPAEPVPVDRKAAIARAARAETPAEARLRIG